MLSGPPCIQSHCRGLDAHFTHQSVNPSSTTRIASISKLLVHPGGPIAATKSLVEFLDKLHQLYVILAMLTDGTFAPGVEATARNTQQFTELGDFVESAILLDEGELYFFALEKNRLAFFRISSSSWLAASDFSSSFIRFCALSNSASVAGSEWLCCFVFDFFGAFFFIG